jgi:hypothetical protein
MRLTAADWKRRAEAKERQHRSSTFERRQQQLAVAKQIRRELRDEKRKSA